MGQSASQMLCDEEIEDLLESTVFTYHEIELLYERFKLLDRGNRGHITFNDLIMLPEFHSNPLSGLILNAIEEKHGYENMTLIHYIEFMQIFNQKTDKRERIKFLFKVIDINRDGKICKKTLKRLYQILYGDLVDEVDTLIEVKRVLNAFDQGNKGYIGYKDFVRFYNADKEIDEVLKINFIKNHKD